MPSIKEYFPGLKGGFVNFDGISIADLGDVLDANGNEILEFDTVASAVNQVRIANSAASSPVVISAAGDDTNIGLDLDPKGTGALRVLSAATTGNAVDIVGAALTTGKGIDLSDLGAITTGKALHIDATGVTQTDGILVHINSASTALTSTGRLLLVDHTGASGVSTVVAEVKSAAADETTILKVTATAALAAGVALDISAAALTTGKLIDMSDLDAITTGKAIHVDATGVTHTTGVLVHLDSAATAITGAGRIFLSDHTGATTTSGILNEFASAANDESVILKVTSSAALATGVALQVSGASVTTGTLLSIADANALTTGGVAAFVSNSADTGTRSIVQIKQDNASASGATALEVWQDGALAAIKITGNPTIGIDLTAMANTEQSINFTAGTGSTAAPQTNAPTGFVKVGVAGTDQWIPYYNAT